MKSRTRNTQTYEVGGIYGFKTSPFTEFSPAETKRFSALRVLSINPPGGIPGVVFAVLDCILDQMPTVDQLAKAKTLTCHRFKNFSGRPALHSSRQEYDNDLLEFRHIATLPLSADDHELAAQNNSYGGWSSASFHAEGEWRWVHDREALVQEVELAKAKRDAKLEADRLHYETRLKGLTWDTLLAEAVFERWSTHPPFPPPEFVSAARARVRKAILDLQALGAKPKKPAVRAILKECVEWFNEQDDASGSVIETEEREDICLVLTELAAVARHRSLAEEFDEWRDW